LKSFELVYSESRKNQDLLVTIVKRSCKGIFSFDLGQQLDKAYDTNYKSAMKLVDVQVIVLRKQL